MKKPIIIDHEAETLQFGRHVTWEKALAAVAEGRHLIWKRSGVWGIIPRPLLLNLLSARDDYFVLKAEQDAGRRRYTPAPRSLGLVHWEQVISPPQATVAVTLSAPRRRPDRPPQ